MQETRERRKKINTLRDSAYDKNRLKGMFLIKGAGQYLAPASEILCLTEGKTSYKINHAMLSHEETLMIAKGLGLTAREYIDIFCKDIFTDE